jgi:hypothetical protein
MDRELDKMVDAAIKEAIIQKYEKWNYEDEIANAEESYCCDDCQGQVAYYLKR